MIYTLKQIRKSKRPRDFYKVLRSHNTCKACALGMSGMKNELGSGFQVCKKSMQAVAQDLQPGIPQEFYSSHSIDEFKNLTGKELEALGRLAHPLLIASYDDHFRVLTWEEAYNKLVTKIKDIIPSRSFYYMSGRSSNEAAFLIQLLARQSGTNNVNNCSYYCHQASGVGLKQAIGSGTATVMLEDVEKADLVVVIGANPSSNHPRFITHLANVRKNGGKVVIVNPYKETGLINFKIPSKPLSAMFGTKISDYYIQPHCGGDMAFIKALTVFMYKEKQVSLEFIEKYCNNVENFKNDLESSNYKELLDISGVSIADLETLANYLLNAKNVIFAWAMGLTHQIHGTQTIRTLANLALVLGQIGRESTGLLPLRGHSNVQGVGSVGVVPKLPVGMIEQMLKTLDVTIPEEEGLDTFSCMEVAEQGKIDFAMLLGGNLLGSNPNTSWATSALNKIGFTCHISTTFNKSHIFGRGKEALILPVRVRDEETQFTSQESMFNYVRLSFGGFEPPIADLPSETEILTKLGADIFGNQEINWDELRNHNKIRELIAETVPNYHPISELNETGGEFTIPGRIKHKPQFNTDNKKANLFVGNPPDTRPAEGKFNLMSFRSEGQFNTIIYDEDDMYRGVKHRNIIFMNILDATNNQLNEGDLVEVSSEVGILIVELVIRPIRQGNVAMYFPEANVLIPGDVDPQSRTPGFKRTLVSIKKKVN